ncbi:NAD-dependent epimerase/dehydratase family protein [Streptomyces flavofungini]|uniref:NAD-dependent epimerase/dehydratase family protein n=1 Tax=Streptomyces flavofungini TaxID=68200 RepID=UPI0025B04D0E|nr:NAD-dependent epimerase/dehydratase family protein [Streptomyces flavofungini]WJV47455.1 NAD-dependent epimerase/dehydratase family protein [Streptomyces flavofungini]
MSGTRVVLTGATGFIGSAVLRELALLGEAGDGHGRPHITAVARRPPAHRTPADTWVTADLGSPDTLRGLCEGADVLLHLACALGPDAATCTVVNVDGTAALMGQARRAGTPRIVHLSTAAVYGPGPHRGADVHDLVPAPVSPASRTRLAGEAPALAAGATVLRPGLVLGRGDRWVVPALAELRARVPARWDGGRGLLSAVDVTALARLIAHLALAAPGARGVPAGVFHASHPEPVRCADLLAELAAHRVLPAADGDLSWDECVERLRATPGRVSERQFALLARDHWYRSDRIWGLAGCAPGPGPLEAVGEAAGWYRALIAGHRGAGSASPTA